MNVSVDKLADAVVSEMKKYAGVLTEDVKKDVKDVAKECLAEVKTKSPKRTGNYSRSWKSKAVYESSTSIVVKIYNKEHYRLTHLLENGHVTRNGGRTQAQPHIRPAEQAASQKLQRKIEVDIRDIK